MQIVGVKRRSTSSNSSKKQRSKDGKAVTNFIEIDLSVSEPDDLAPPSLSFDDAYEPELAFDDDESSSLEDELNDQEEDALIVTPAASPPRNLHST